ncbi:hypothetical protein [Pseudacidovorax intermedius]|nr:hypothetical protein [Pseudacidovorax intermedius]
MPSEFDVQEDLLLIVDIEESITQTVRLGGDPKHAAALAGRHVRQQGLTDGEPSVVVHTSFRRGGEYELLFSAYPATRWRAVQVWASAQSHSVAVVPIMSLLWRFLGQGKALIYRSGSRFTFLANLGGSPVQFSTQAFSEDASDLSAMAGVLAEGIRAQLAQSPAGADAISTLGTISWVCRLVEAPDREAIDKEIIAKIAASLKTGIVPIVHEPLAGGSAGWMSGLAALRRVYRPSLAVCAPADRAALTALSQLRSAAWVSLAIAALSAAGAAGFALSTSSLRTAAQQTEKEADRIEENIRQRASAATLPPAFEETRALVERLSTFTSSPDLTQILGALAAAGGSGVRVLRVYTVQAEKTPARTVGAASTGSGTQNSTSGQGPRIQIDATVDVSANRAEADALSDFVALLRKQGFSVAEVEGQARGSLANGRTVFSYQIRSTRSNPQGQVQR